MEKGIPRRRFAGILALAFIALTASNLGRAQPVADAPDGGGRWVGTWASSPQLTEPSNLPPTPGFADATLRQIVHVSIGGKQLRVRFSNAFGTTPLTITSAHVALSAGGSAIRPEGGQALTFHRRPSIIIPPGARACRRHFLRVAPAGRHFPPCRSALLLFLVVVIFAPVARGDHDRAFTFPAAEALSPQGVIHRVTFLA